MSSTTPSSGATQPRPVTFGIRVPNSGPFAEAANIEAVARQAERCGYSTLWVHDHIPWAKEMLTHFSTGSIEACKDQDPNFFETVTTMAYLAGICPTMDVGIAGLVLPLRDPRVLAKQLMTAQVLTGGRFITALAIGNIPNDFEVMQQPYNRRGKITDEFIEALTTAYKPGPSTFQGERLAFEGAEFYPKPADARFWIAGNSPPAYRRIAQYATGWLPGGLTPDDYRNGLALVDEALQAHGRTLAEIERGDELFFCLQEDNQEALDTAAASLAHRFGSFERGLERNIVGGPEEVLAKIEAFRQAGVTHFELRCVGHTLDSHLRMMELFQEAVAPKIQPFAAF